MRKFVFLSFLLAPAVLYPRGAEKDFQVLDFSGGLNSYYSPLAIADNEVKDCVNVFFDVQNGVTKRNGFTIFGSTTAFPVTQMWTYRDSASTDWIVIRSSGNIMASPGTGVFTTLVATCPTTGDVDATNANGNIFFVDQSQGVYYWNATSTTYVGGSPKGTFIREFHGSLWVAGLAFPNQNQLYRSKYLDGTNWTAGILPTSAAVYTVGLNDSQDSISGLFSGYNDVLYIFKTQSIWSLTGFDQTDFLIRTLTRDAGCVDSGSIQNWRGYLVFLSQRGIERFDGYHSVRISKKIKDKVDASTTRFYNSRSWNQTTSSDFGMGSFPFNSVFGDTETVSGAVYLTFPDTFDALRDGTGGTKNVWTQALNGTGGSISAGGTLNMTLPGGSLTDEYLRTTNALANFQQGTTYHFEINSLPADAGNLSEFRVVLSSIASTSSHPENLHSHWYVEFRNDSGTAFVSDGGDDTFDSIFISSTGIQIPFKLDIFLSTNTFQYSVNGTVVNSGVSTWAANPVYVYLVYENGSAGSRTFQGDNFIVTPEQTSFTSQIKTIGAAITTFGNFAASNDANGGTINWGICVSSNSNMNPRVCTAQSANAQITASANTYLTVTSTITKTDYTTNFVPGFLDFTVNWNEGLLRPRTASAVYDDRYWLGLTTTTADNFNDAVIVASMKEDGATPLFTMFDINAGAMTVFKNNLYHGDSNSTGKIYLDNQGYSDNGNAINAYITSKDYAIENIVDDKFFDSMYVEAEALGNYSLNSTYFVDRSTIPYALSTITQNEQSGFINQKIPMPIDSNHQVYAKTISLKFSNSNNNEPMNVYGAVVQYHLRPTQ